MTLHSLTTIDTLCLGSVTGGQDRQKKQVRGPQQPADTRSFCDKEPFACANMRDGGGNI